MNPLPIDSVCYSVTIHLAVKDTHVSYWLDSPVPNILENQWNTGLTGLRDWLVTA